MCYIQWNMVNVVKWVASSLPDWWKISRWRTPEFERPRDYWDYSPIFSSSALVLSHLYLWNRSHHKLVILMQVSLTSILFSTISIHCNYFLSNFNTAIVQLVKSLSTIIQYCFPFSFIPSTIFLSVSSINDPDSSSGACNFQFDEFLHGSQKKTVGLGDTIQVSIVRSISNNYYPSSVSI